MSASISSKPAVRDDRFLILIPNYNDWPSLELLIKSLDHTMQAHKIETDLLIVDDGSTTPPGEALEYTTYQSLGRIEILKLRRNLGHQRAIAIGLAYVEAHISCLAVVVMDADGEDDPGDVPRLIQKCRDEGLRKIVFAESLRIFLLGNTRYHQWYERTLRTGRRPTGHEHGPAISTDSGSGRPPTPPASRSPQGDHSTTDLG